MATNTPKLYIVDPLTLLGRELLRLIEDTESIAGEIGYLHTADDDEQQIAEIGGEPALVPPLSGPDQLNDGTAVIIASDRDSDRVDHLVEFLEGGPAVPLVDAGRLMKLTALTQPAATARDHEGHTALRVAHPSLVAMSLIAAAVDHLGPTGGSVAAIEPASALGHAAILALARQGGHRIQGAPVEDDDLVAGQIVAFNMVAMPDDELYEEAVSLFPDLDVSLSRSLAGCFHGHVAHISLEFERPVEETEIEDALRDDTKLIIVDPFLSLDSRTDTDQLALTPPRLSPSRRRLATTAMADGLRLGGAVTALELLRSVI